MPTTPNAVAGKGPQPCGLPGAAASVLAGSRVLCAVLLALPGEAAISLTVHSLTCATLEGYADHVGRLARVRAKKVCK